MLVKVWTAQSLKFCKNLSGWCYFSENKRYGRGATLHHPGCTVCISFCVFSIQRKSGKKVRKYSSIRFKPHVHLAPRMNEMWLMIKCTVNVLQRRSPQGCKCRWEDKTERMRSFECWEAEGWQLWTVHSASKNGFITSTSEACFCGDDEQHLLILTRNLLWILKKAGTSD